MISAARQDPPPGATARLADELRELRVELRQVGELRDAVRELLTELRGRTKPLLTVAGVARLVGRSPYRIREWIREGRLSAVRVADTGPRGRLLVAREELQRLLESGRGENLPASACDEPALSEI